MIEYNPVIEIEYVLIAVSIVAVLGHVGLAGKGLRQVGPVQYFFHKIYAVIEPTVLRIVDFFITKRIMRDTAPGRFILTIGAMLSYIFPHGLVVTNRAAEKLVQHIEDVEGPKGARLAVGPCVCQKALGRWEDPSSKDIVVLYGADIYLHLNLGYRLIDAEEAKQVMKACHNKGLVHSLDFCMQSGRWVFVLCNCDKDICVLTRTHFLTGKFLYGGPEVPDWNPDACLGADECGKCIEMCMFNAIEGTGGNPLLNEKKCLGCGQCVRVCVGEARSMVKRIDYKHNKKVPADLLL